MSTNKTKNDTVTLKEIFLNEDVSFTQEEENDTLGECGIPPIPEEEGMLPPGHPPIDEPMETSHVPRGPEYVVIKIVGDSPEGYHEDEHMGGTKVGRFGAPGSPNFDNPGNSEMLYGSDEDEGMYGEGSCGGMHEDMHHGEDRAVLMDEEPQDKSPMELAYTDFLDASDGEEDGMFGELDLDDSEFDFEAEEEGLADREKAREMEDEMDGKHEGPGNDQKMSFWQMRDEEIF